jgi:hypothetical protein
VAINVTIWDKHASAFGLVILLFTLAGGVLYQQSVTVKGNIAAPQHEPASEQSKDHSDSAEYDEEKQKLVSSGERPSA